MDSWFQDIRFAMKTLVGRPWITVLAILALAIGIGFNTAIFSVVHGVLLRQLPYPEAEKVAMLWLDNQQQGWEEDLTSYPNFVDWRERSESFASMAAFSSASAHLTGGNEPVRLAGAAVDAALLDVLGTTPAHGRRFTEEETLPGQGDVILLSHQLWQGRFGGDLSILETRIEIDESPVTVIGIMPPDFNFPAGVKDMPNRVDFWRPLVVAEPYREARLALWLSVVGRLADGVTMEGAKTEMRGLGKVLEGEHPETNAGFGINVVPLGEHLVGKVRTALFLLLGAVTLVLLIACANVANLLLARATTRQQEVSVRAAMGASRWRLVRQMLVESSVLALLGGVAGILVALFAVDFLLGLQPPELPRMDSIAIDSRILLFTLGVSRVTGILFGLAPATAASRADMHSLLKEGARGDSGGLRGLRLRDTLVVAEIALALVLLIAAGLTLRSLQKLHGVDPGFGTEGIVTLDLSLRSSRYEEGAAVQSFYRELQENLTALPEVESAAFASDILLGEFPNTTIIDLEGEPPLPREEQREVSFTAVTPGFFSTLGIPVEGEEFNSTHDSEGPRVALVNRTLASSRWGDRNPIGLRFRPSSDDREDAWFQVLGVVEDTRRSGLDRPPRPEMYFPHAQFPFGTMVLVAKRVQGSQAQSGAFASMLRKTVWAVDERLPLPPAETLEERLAATSAQRRFYSLLLGIFAAIAAVLAAIGLYGVLSYNIQQRRREIGIRMALGASRREILWRILRKGLLRGLLGVAIGLPIAAASSRVVESLLFGVTGTDPWTLAAVALGLVAIALLASWVPAMRATRLDPVAVLGSE